MIVLALMLGVIDPSCTKEKVCQDRYTKTVRPPARYTNALKERQITNGMSDCLSPSECEEDHFIPLELCGCATCVENLWPQPWPEARKKDADETRLHRSVCKGEMTLEAAQAELRRKWSR